jgi:flavin reductase (DIM6/NTAB) family NADH-FMN oxidoreductase RutF
LKIEISDQFPKHFVHEWPGQYDIFSHLEFACGIPQAIFAVSTQKVNGKPNLCPQSWSSFFGNNKGYYVVLGGLTKSSHTYQNILYGKSFCVNFLNSSYFDSLMQCIAHNSDEDDEIAACDLHGEKAETVDAPRIAEAFLTLECELNQCTEIAGNADLSLIVGRVKHAAIDESYATGIDGKYGADGFFFNIHTPVDWKSGQCSPVGIGTLRVERTV